MESKINKLSMRQILKEVGFPLMKNEFRNTYKFNVDLDIAIQFEEDLTKIRDIMEIEKIICAYEEIFDKEVYVFHLARLLEQDIEMHKRNELLGTEYTEQLVFTSDTTGKNKRRFFVNAKNLLRTCDVVDIVMKKKSKGEFEIYSSIDFIDEGLLESNNRETIAEEKLYRIEEKIGLKNVLSYLKNSDLIEICKYPNLATLLIVNQDKFEKKVKKYFQYMDIEKLLILSNAIYFYRYGETLDNISKEEAINLKKYTLAIAEIIGNNVKPIKTTKFDFTIDFNDIKNKVQNLVSDEEILQNDFDKKEEIIEVEPEDIEDRDKEVEIEITEENNMQNEEQVIEIEENQDVISEVEETNNTDSKPYEEPIKTEYIMKFINDENKSIIDVDIIKETIMKLDEDSTQEKMEDGTNVFTLPNKKCYIVQPLSKSFYGTATYIIENDVFESQREKIINNNKINLKELEKIKSDNVIGMYKIVHTGWENSLETFFDIRKNEKYTKEEIENIEKIVYEIKK